MTIRVSTETNHHIQIEIRESDMELPFDMFCERVIKPSWYQMHNLIEEAKQERGRT